MYTQITERSAIRQVDVYRGEFNGERGAASVWLRSHDTCVAFDLEEIPWLISALQRAHAAGVAATPDQIGEIAAFNRHDEKVKAAGENADRERAEREKAL